MTLEVVFTDEQQITLIVDPGRGPQGPIGPQGDPGESGTVDGTGLVTQEELLAHELSATPHPVWDDGPSLTLLYENAKV